MSDPEWYAPGLRFACTQCGNCCSGPPGYVWFSVKEGLAIARHLGISEDQFYQRYARKFGRKWSLKDLKCASTDGESDRHDCVFLDRETQPGKALCSIYQVRPGQCRTWPFWPENLESPEAWSGAKERTPCPGMGRGAVVSLAQIRVRRDASIS